MTDDPGEAPQMVYIRKAGEQVELCMWTPLHQMIVIPINDKTRLNLLKDLVQAL